MSSLTYSLYSQVVPPGVVVGVEEEGVVGQPAHPEYHHQDDQHLHDLKVEGDVAKVAKVAKFKFKSVERRFPRSPSSKKQSFDGAQMGVAAVGCC